RESRTAAIVESKLRRISVRELVIAAVLKKSPHRPRVPMKIATELHGVPPQLPRVHISNFIRRIPSVHRCGGERITDSCVALRGEPRRAPGILSAKSYALNSQRANDVVYSVVLRRVIHRQARNRNRTRIDLVRSKNVVPRNYGLL